MYKSIRNLRIYLILVLFLLTVLACNLSGSTQPTAAFTLTPELLPATDIPIETVATETAAATTDALSAWITIAGTWSGCTDSPQPSVPYLAVACNTPRGDFVTLYLKEECAIGEQCGNLVKATFNSEFILLELTFVSEQDNIILMHGNASSDMFSWASTDLTIQREGSNLRITELTGQQYIYVLPPGCDAIIQSNTSIGCYEHIP